MNIKERKEQVQKEFEDIKKKIDQMAQQIQLGKSKLDQLAGQYKLLEELEIEEKNKEEDTNGR